ncbi:solute carrier family 52, riboflavin transporter, member 3 [Protopterus annectens]|uniref:solute carrier family 52, riboflavin transporter, member 3 n=1 Tax=Protopterus annectens TaxID=7888 RepID=UPI001CFBBF9B|nr:solute carrier family 52, riboflavin transporter, member 3 [Protopterus annectens]
MSWLIHLLTCVFGTGSWVAINGLWVELPLIVNELPEGWFLPSYLTVIIQLANIGPLFVTLMHRFAPGKLKEVGVIYTVISIGFVACFMLAFFWKQTTVIAGELHSTAFLIITFFLSLVDCTSSVTFLPFMMQLPSGYLTTYYIGEGLSGLIPGLVALGQGAGMVKCINVTVNTTMDSGMKGEDIYKIETQYLPANFSPEVFFFFLSAMMVACLSAFGFLTRFVWKLGSSTVNLMNDQMACATSSMPEVQFDTTSLGRGSHIVTELQVQDNKTHYGDGEEKKESDVKVRYSTIQYGLIYFLVAWVNALTNGVLPSVQTYSCMPYGNTAYHLSATLGAMANPLACIIAIFLPCRSLALLGSLSLIGTGFGAYNLAMASLSPCPVLQNSDIGVAIIVLSWIFFIGTLSYTKVMTGIILRDKSHSALVWCGAVVQLGSMIGTLVMFPLVNVYQLFKAGDVCTTQCPL